MTQCECGIDAVTAPGIARPMPKIIYCPLHAAAPDLLAACKDTVTLLEVYATRTSTIVKVLSKLHAAIAKAEGNKTEAERVADPNYTPTVEEAARNPKEFVDGFEEI